MPATRVMKAELIDRAIAPEVPDPEEPPPEGAATPAGGLSVPLMGAVTVGSGKAVAPLGIGLGRTDAEAPTPTIPFSTCC